MEDDQKVELLSPAGNAEGFYGAIRAGADAVYLAGNRFGARAYAENFTTEELVACIRYGHLMGRKIYLTVNTLVKESELAVLYDYLQPFCEAGLDAVIVQDLGVLRFIREHFPECRLHVSTQMTLCGRHGASLLKEMGACRIVPSRELGLQELISIKRNAGVEVEAFIHGAMCYCYSGQCLFSSILGGRSGNRGRCAQPCRLPYSVIAGKDRTMDACYPLSLKDMCTIEHIPQLIEAGIDSFKIEGRMKKPEYTAGVTALYRRYVDKYYELRRKGGPQEASRAYHVEREDLEALRSLYIRSEIQDGYYFRRNGREMITLDSPAYSGSNEKLLQKIHEKYLNAPLKLPVAVTAVFRSGQPARVVMEWQGIQAEAEGALVERAQKQPISPENVRKQLGKLGESPFYASDIKVFVEENCFYPLKQLNELRRDAVSELERRILAAGGYGNAACSGEVRDKKRQSLCFDRTGKAPQNAASAGYAFSVRKVRQMEAIVCWLQENPACRHVRIYIDGDLYLQEQEAVETLCGKLSERGAFFVALPYIIRESDDSYLERLYMLAKERGFFQGFLVRSMDGLGFLREKGSNLSRRADAGLYIWNHSAFRELSHLLDGFCLPYELNAREQQALLDSLSGEDFSCEKIVYGRIPMMITANCLMRTGGKCLKETGWANLSKQKEVRKNVEGERPLAAQRHMEGEKDFADRRHTEGENAPAVWEQEDRDRHIIALRDRYHKDFPVEVNCAHCMNILYNSVPFSLRQSLSKWSGRTDLRMDFTLESAAEVKQLLDSFLKGTPLPLQEYTTGHEKRGVE